MKMKKLFGRNSALSLAALLLLGFGMMPTAQAQIPQFTFCTAGFAPAWNTPQSTGCMGLIVQTESQLTLHCWGQGPDTRCNGVVNHRARARAVTVSGHNIISRQARAMVPFNCELVIPAARPPLLPPLWGPWCNMGNVKPAGIQMIIVHGPA